MKRFQLVNRYFLNNICDCTTTAWSRVLKEIGSHLSGQPFVYSECLFSCPQESTNWFYHEPIECSLHFQIHSFTNYLCIFLLSVPLSLIIFSGAPETFHLCISCTQCIHMRCPSQFSWINHPVKMKGRGYLGDLGVDGGIIPVVYFTLIK